MKIWLDDLRVAPDGWKWVKTAQEAIALLETEHVEKISLDHDLGDDEKFGTGYTVVKWVEEKVFTSDYVPPVIVIHSANIVGRSNMEKGLDHIWQHLINR
jgi:hypothetical protein